MENGSNRKRKGPDIKTFMKFVEFLGKSLRKNRFPKKRSGGTTAILVSKRKRPRQKTASQGLRRSTRIRQPAMQHLSNEAVIVHSPKQYKYWTGRYPEKNDERVTRKSSREQKILYRLF
ncbi:unnamed protein product [Callosobruchus maculatus]|uniref:Uncharacterized protein n=1 Tax=Callosobruchus maculatus TaxID=64391 RepID=A0A653CBY2_CALMS|nr:unnamed protein product [Callosobruchus maculatus]